MITSRTERPSSNGFLVERRRTPDRRTQWRGGRRDSDWTNRPSGTRIPTVEAAPSGGRWKSRLLSFHLW